LSLVKIAVKARTVGRDQRKAAHLVFVVDSSASMAQADRLPLIQQGVSRLVEMLGPNDRVSLVSCSDQARLLLDRVPASDRDTVLQAVHTIQPSGSTNLLAGLQLGYGTAKTHYTAGQINQVILCSDGVANVGATEAESVLEAVAADRKQGIMLMCVGVGYGAYNDVLLEALANQGDGRYVFVDGADQVERVFVRPLASALQTVAKDARIQVKFNPQVVRRYRLVGYENRDIKDEQFRDDTVDAGEVGSGQCVTALYEIELTNSHVGQGDLGTVFVRYKDTDTEAFEEIARPLTGTLIRRRTVAQSPRFYLAASAARFAEWLRQSEHAKATRLDQILSMMDQISAALPLDQDVRELTDLIRQAEGLPRAP
jgi:Ca-activated chloride channel family protein